MTTTSTDMIQLHAYLNGFALGGLVDSLNLATLSNNQGPLLPRLMAEGQGYDITRSENIAKATCLWMGRYRPASACADFLMPRLDIGYQLFTGFALSAESGLWCAHTFLVYQGAIIEPTDKLYQHYVGIEMTGNDLLDYFV